MAKSQSFSTISGVAGADMKKLGTSPQRWVTLRGNGASMAQSYGCKPVGSRSPHRAASTIFLARASWRTVVTLG